MPRFFFHLHDGRGNLDTIGTELSDAVVAELEAIKFAGEILKDYPGQVSSHGGCHVEVTDDVGQPLFQLAFTVSGYSALAAASKSSP